MKRKSVSENPREDIFREGGEETAEDRATGADERREKHDMAVTLALIFLGSFLFSFLVQLGFRLLLRYVLFPA